MNKGANYQPQPSRQAIGAWIHMLLPDIQPNIRIEDLGKGVTYCRIINYYFPGSILINRIIWHPKTEYENTLNLRIAQNAMAQLKINLPIDPIKLSKEKLNDNWTFVTALYRYLTQSQEEPLANSAKEEKLSYNVYTSKVTPSHNHPNVHTPKRPLQNIYSQPFFSNMMRHSFYGQDVNAQQKSYYNASKYSVGKLYKESSSMQTGTSSPNKGKWSVNSHMFQNNLMPIIDRVKQILLKSSHDTEKIRQIKMLLNIPLNEEVVVKVEEDDINPIITIISGNHPGKEADSTNKENKLGSETLIQTKEEIKL